MDSQNMNNDFNNQNYQQMPEEPKKDNSKTLAIVSLVLSICSLVFGCCCTYLGIALAIAGVVCGVLSQKKNSSGMAIAGIIIGAIGILVSGALMIIGFVLSAQMANDPAALQQMIENMVNGY